MKQHTINKQNNFISGWYLPNASICDELLTHYNTSDKTLGVVGNNDNKSIVDYSIKKCTQVIVEKDTDLWRKYLVENLQSVVERYIEQYPFVNKQNRWTCIQSFSIQHYLPSEAFYEWHCERAHHKDLIGSRHLVFMTYLNDVDDGGETEFYHQNVRIKPEKGLTLIWPVDWTFTHRGLTSKTQEKYIVTGWFNFY